MGVVRVISSLTPVRLKGFCNETVRMRMKYEVWECILAARSSLTIPCYSGCLATNLRNFVLGKMIYDLTKHTLHQQRPRTKQPKLFSFIDGSSIFSCQLMGQSKELRQWRLLYLHYSLK